MTVTLDEYPKQLWQVPARIASEHGLGEAAAANFGTRLADGGLITVEDARAWLAEHPEHAPQV